ncbi:uncharacterized protein LOC109265954 isoform X2 [Panthera pardus]|uniref:Uncharacterized protein LOC109265954 isoform X2 n=1 Tax=Panthera pardus TaxID=9691 RepID=A0A9V1FHU9_PANPR|nr:uncharacterized protein LOC109265954 isoform X2 [Panthera pardus]XP_042771676.1 cysteinyl leukotriene receptor 2 isoform X3 [Panthera leo]
MEAEVWKAEGVKGLTCFPSFYLWQSLQGYMLKTAKLKNVYSCVPHLAGNHQVTSTLDFRANLESQLSSVYKLLNIDSFGESLKVQGP